LGIDGHQSTQKSDVDIICASGFGGTSLINTVIASRPEYLVFKQKDWPKEIRDAYAQGTISKYMDKAQGLLRSNRNSRTASSPKALKHKEIATKLGLPYGEFVLNINQEFQNGRANAQDIPQNACTLCGDCCTGCNVGAKKFSQ
jgi:cholesterol oxidase